MRAQFSETAHALGREARAEDGPLVGLLRDGDPTEVDRRRRRLLDALANYDAATIATCCACSLIVHPAITWGLAQALGLDTAALRSAVLTAAMAPGVNAYLFANVYGVAKRVAASSVLIATALSTLTIWMWLALLP